jgi:hypothetical protein
MVVPIEDECSALPEEERGPAPRSMGQDVSPGGRAPQDGRHGAGRTGFMRVGRYRAFVARGGIARWLSCVFLPGLGSSLLLTRLEFLLDAFADRSGDRLVSFVARVLVDHGRLDR